MFSQNEKKDLNNITLTYKLFYNCLIELIHVHSIFFETFQTSNEQTLLWTIDYHFARGIIFFLII